MNCLLYAAAGVVGRVIGTCASYGFNALWPSDAFNAPADRLWAQAGSRARTPVCPHSLSQCAQDCQCEESPRAPRVVEGRGLGPDERFIEWTDNEGLQWRYTHGEWLCGFEDGWAPQHPYDFYAPYTEIIKPSPADGEASGACGPAAGESPVAPRPPAGATGQPNISYVDLHAAANGLQAWRDGEPCPRHNQVAWTAIADRIYAHAAALKAQK